MNRPMYVRCAVFAVTILVLLLALSSPSRAQIAPPGMDTEIAALVDSVSTDSLEAMVLKLQGFFTRHTNSDTLSDSVGIGAARRWVYSRFVDISNENGGNLQVSYHDFEATVDEISVETDRLLNEYRLTLRQIDSLRSYTEQLEDLIGAQRDEIASVQEQIDKLAIIGREVGPLMTRMVDALEEFVSLDVPFLLEERHERVRQLCDLMRRADVTVSEKYRRVIEAYEIKQVEQTLS